MNFYSKPSIHQMADLPFLSRMQGSGETPLIPDCDGNSTADCGATENLGLSCCDGCGTNAGDRVFISILIPGSDCSSNPFCSIDQLFDGSTPLSTVCDISNQTPCTEGCLVEYTCNYASTSGICANQDPSSLTAQVTCDGKSSDCTPQQVP